MDTGEIVLAAAWSVSVLAFQVWRLSSYMIALHGREHVARTARLGWLWSMASSNAPARRTYYVSVAALTPLFLLGFAGVSTGTAQLIAIAGTALSFLVSIVSLAADGDLRERAGPGRDHAPPADIAGP
jgi:hypothetical protein